MIDGRRGSWLRRTSGVIIREQDIEGIDGWVFGDAVQGGCERQDRIRRISLPDGVKHSHQHPSGLGTRLGLGTKAHLAGNHRWTQLSLGQVAVRRNASVFGPMLQEMLVCMEHLLETALSKMPCRAMAVSIIWDSASRA